jgi:arylsulfatase A-like enzyme
LRYRLLCGLLIALCPSLFTCGRQAEPYNVLLIGVDTLRPDHLGCYGYERPTSPNIDRLAAEGVLLEKTVSQCPWTLPSFATALTSLYPSQHGAGINMSTMRTSFPTLAEILRDSGYSTGAVINVSVLRPEFGVDRGFDHYDVAEPNVRRTADEVTRIALDWIDLNRDKPFFAFVHYFDPHLSYAPPAPYDTLFDPGYRGRVGRSFERDDYLDLKSVLLEQTDQQTGADWNHIRALYDGEIAFTDEAIGKLLAGIADRGLTKSTLVVFLGDHGEEFSEHDGFGHGHTLFREVINVPLIFRLPGRLAGRARVERQVRLVDVVPTVLDLLGIEADAHFEGVSLAPLLTQAGRLERPGQSLLPPEVAFSEGLQRGTERKGLSAYPWKFVYDMKTGDEVLYDLRQDPAESANVRDGRGDVVDLLKGMLFGCLLATSDTWYVEIAGDGRGHSVDIRIEAERGGGRGKIFFYKFFDATRSVVDIGTVVNRNKFGSVLEIEDLIVKDKIVLAFKAEAPVGVPLTFDLRMDGESALNASFVGETLKNPKVMPFSKRPRGAACTSAGGPPGRPRPPYILIWHHEAQHSGQMSADLGDETLRDLRALGYIQ